MLNDQIINYNKYYETIKNKYTQLTQKHSEIDMKESDILHYIELEKTTAKQNNQLVKLLREIRQERRKIKFELAEIQKINARLTAPLELIEPKPYNYRTNVMEMLTK